MIGMRDLILSKFGVPLICEQKLESDCKRLWYKLDCDCKLVSFKLGCTFWKAVCGLGPKLAKGLLTL